MSLWLRQCNYINAKLGNGVFSEDEDVVTTSQLSNVVMAPDQSNHKCCQPPAVFTISGDDFSLGWAPSGWQSITEHIMSCYHNIKLQTYILSQSLELTVALSTMIIDVILLVLAGSVSRCWMRIIVGMSSVSTCPSSVHYISPLSAISWIVAINSQSRA